MYVHLYSHLNEFEIHGFEWDQGNIEKCLVHGLNVQEIESVFHNTPYVSMNIRHHAKEERLHAVGITFKGKHAFIVFTFRKGPNGTLIRPISARYMHKKEIDHYEKQTKD